MAGLSGPMTACCRPETRVLLYVLVQNPVTGDDKSNVHDARKAVEDRGTLWKDLEWVLEMPEKCRKRAKLVQRVNHLQIN